jgi:hypothetical protein
MRVYWLSPCEGKPWLAPGMVVERWRASFPHVYADAQAAQGRAEKFIARYRALLAAGLGHDPTPLEEVERRWSGALLVEVCADAAGANRFRTVVFTAHRLELEFGAEVAARRRRPLAARAAQALGYRVASVDGD